MEVNKWVIQRSTGVVEKWAQKKEEQEKKIKKNNSKWIKLIRLNP